MFVTVNVFVFCVWSVQRILDHADDLSLPQVRLFMDLLCAVAYPSVPTDHVPELRDHLDMLVRKQVSSTFDR